MLDVEPFPEYIPRSEGIPIFTLPSTCLVRLKFYYFIEVQLVQAVSINHWVIIALGTPDGEKVDTATYY